MNFKELLSNNPFDRKWSNNLSLKIANPPNLKVKNCFCLWSDLLGFGNYFYENNWILQEDVQKLIYERLSVAHSSVLYYSSPLERILVLNDGIAKIYHPKTSTQDLNNILNISMFLRSCVELHMSINSSEKRMNYPGCRTVLTYGNNIEYLCSEVRYDDYVMNYSKSDINKLSNICEKNGNPQIIYNPKEFQMNTAFSKAFILDNGGTKWGLKGNKFFIDHSSIEAILQFSINKGYSPVWVEEEEGIKCFIPYSQGDINNVVMGFYFNRDIINIDNDKIKTKIFELLRFYPWDEPTSEFYFDLNCTI